MELVFPEIAQRGTRFRRSRMEGVIHSTEVSPANLLGRSPRQGQFPPRVSITVTPNLHEISLLGRNRIKLIWTKRRAEPLSPLSREMRVTGNGMPGLRVRATGIKPGQFSPTRSRLRSVALELPALRSSD